MFVLDRSCLHNSILITKQTVVVSMKAIIIDKDIVSLFMLRR